MTGAEWFVLALALAVVVFGYRWLARELWQRGGNGWGGRPYYTGGTAKGFDWRTRLREIQEKRAASRSTMDEPK